MKAACKCCTQKKMLFFLLWISEIDTWHLEADINQLTECFIIPQRFIKEINPDLHTLQWAQFPLPERINHPHMDRQPLCCWLGFTLCYHSCLSIFLLLDWWTFALIHFYVKKKIFDLKSHILQGKRYNKSLEKGGKTIRSI